MLNEEEIYNPGKYTYQWKRAAFASIREMRDKAGFIAKRIPFNREFYVTYENFKNATIENSQIVDKYFLKYLPQYYFTFQEAENPTHQAAYYFMEDIISDEEMPGQKPVDELDEFVATFIQTYLDTYNNPDKPRDQTGISLDLAERNLVYGHTLTNPKPKLYFVDLHPIYKRKLKQKIMEEIQIFLEAYINMGKTFPKTEEKFKLLMELPN